MVFSYREVYVTGSARAAAIAAATCGPCANAVICAAYPGAVA